ncbi:MAG TPA: hypothetical protein VIW64_03335 [Pyrinomonadaceae bacterium]|jgi:hypothetical protein
MKTIFLRSTAILGLLFMLAIANVNAQTASHVEVKIPFDFSTGKTTLKAGTYSIRQTSATALLIRSLDGKTAVLVNAPLTIGSRDSKAGQRLVFNQYGEQFFLSQVWLSVDSGRQIFTSGAEARAAHEFRLANNDAKPKRVEIALHQ